MIYLGIVAVCLLTMYIAGELSYGMYLAAGVTKDNNYYGLHDNEYKKYKRLETLMSVLYTLAFLILIISTMLSITIAVTAIMSTLPSGIS